jgi:hypothetical protein
LRLWHRSRAVLWPISRFRRRVRPNPWTDKIFGGVLWATVILKVAARCCCCSHRRPSACSRACPCRCPPCTRRCWRHSSCSCRRLRLAGAATDDRPRAGGFCRHRQNRRLPPARDVLAVAADLMFAAIFARWLFAKPSHAPATAAPGAIIAR